MSRAPIHIMRFAPSDYVNDPVVKLALARRDLAASAFYPLFLFHSHMEGGSLPAALALLAAAVGMKEGDVRKAVAFWVEHGKLVERDGRLYNRRVAEEVAKELEFRAEQSDYGKLGGRPRKDAQPMNKEKATLSDPESPPAPSPAPAPVPAPAPAPSNGTAPRLSREEREEYGQEVWRAFCKRRGSTNPRMSSREFNQILRWLEDRVPLSVVVQGIEGCGGKPHTLNYCAPAVQQELERVSAALGRPP